MSDEIQILQEMAARDVVDHARLDGKLDRVQAELTEIKVQLAAFKVRLTVLYSGMATLISAVVAYVVSRA